MALSECSPSIRPTEPLMRTMIHFRIRVRFGNHKDPFNRFPGPLQRKLLQTLAMADVPPNPISKRPVCPSCSKPARICLCSRLKKPGLENSVGVTILQHSLEGKHPLNSARIAKLGLKNVKIATVSDVNFEARFTIRFPEPNSGTHFDQNAAQKPQIPAQNRDFISNSESLVINSELREGGVELSCVKPETLESASQVHDEGAIITATIGKHGVVNSFDHIWMQQPSLQKLKIDEILTSPAIRASLAEGFIVKKLQQRQLNGSKELEEYTEFEIEVPPKSVLLFPSENAFSVDGGVDGRDFDVNNLIVLDGTWAKARRMYNENPWLRLLPHLKLDLEKMSLYSDVRHQPKIGFLSTIESIVYALKVIGDHPEGLDSLLDVFESMIGDQRRCKDERLKTTNQVQVSDEYEL